MVVFPQIPTILGACHDQPTKSRLSVLPTCRDKILHHQHGALRWINALRLLIPYPKAPRLPGTFPNLTRDPQLNYTKHMLSAMDVIRMQECLPMGRAYINCPSWDLESQEIQQVIRDTIPPRRRNLPQGVPPHRFFRETAHRQAYPGVDLSFL